MNNTNDSTEKPFSGDWQLRAWTPDVGWTWHSRNLAQIWQEMDLDTFVKDLYSFLGHQTASEDAQSFIVQGERPSD